MPNDWFRNTEWNSSISDAFHVKLARARGGRDQYLVIQAAALVRRHPETALELTDLFLETRRSDSDSDMLRGLEVLAESLGELKRGDEMCSAYREVFAVLKASPSLGSYAPFYYPMYVARLKISAEYERALAKSAEAKNKFGGAQLAFMKSAARALIYWEQGRAEAARINADMAVRFGNVRRKGLSVSYDVKVVGFDDKPALKRLLSILKRTARPT